MQNEHSSEQMNNIIDEKMRDAATPYANIEFSAEEAEYAGAFVEDALSEIDADESQIDTESSHDA